MLLVDERRRSRRLPGAIRAERAQRAEQSNAERWFRAGSGLIRSRLRSAGRIAHVGLSPASPRAR